MNRPTTEFDQVRHFTLITGLIWILFWMFFDFSKHNPALMRVNPFLEDPYDAVGSFGLQLAFLAEMVSLVRIVRPYPKGISSEKILLILNGNGVALVAMAVTLAVDLAAMFRFLPKWVGSADGWILALITGGLLFLTGWAGRLVYQTARDTEPPAVIRPWKKNRAGLSCLLDRPCGLPASIAARYFRAAGVSGVASGCRRDSRGPGGDDLPVRPLGCDREMGASCCPMVVRGCSG